MAAFVASAGVAGRSGLSAGDRAGHRDPPCRTELAHPMAVIRAGGVRVKVGDPVPAWSGRTFDGRELVDRDLLRQGPVVLALLRGFG
jgi:hypothetical protein